MNPEVEFERQLAEWLEDGPFEAPDRAIDAAIAHARARPRRRLSRSALWRGAMNRMNLTHIGPRPVRTGWFLAGAVIVVAIVVFAVVGTGAIRLGGDGNQLPAVGGPDSSRATEAPSPTRAPVTGSETCTRKGTFTTATVADVTDYRGVVFECVDTSSDPRASGTGTSAISIDERADGSADMWGTYILRNDRGTWEGRWFGTVDTGYTTHRIDGLYAGTGDYAGLMYRLHMISEDEGVHWTITGAIEPKGAAVTGSETCTTTTSGQPPVNAGDVAAYRGVVLTCTDTMSDPRVSGTGTNNVSVDERADQSADIWGTYTLQNTAGTWQGRWSGTVDAGYTTHHVDGILTGTGAYAGLEYHFQLISEDEAAHSTITGTIEPNP